MSDRKASALGLGIIGTFILFVAANVAAGAFREAGGQILNAGCWLAIGSVRVGDCAGTSPRLGADDGSTSTPTPPPTPDGPLDRLMTYVPRALWETCDSWTLDGAVAAVSCPVTGPVDGVTYRLYDPATRASEEYQKLLAGVDADGGDCSVGPSDVATETGRVGCFDSPVLKRVIVWTDDAKGVLAVATSASASYRELAGWMSSSGKEDG